MSASIKFHRFAKSIISLHNAKSTRYFLQTPLHRCCSDRATPIANVEFLERGPNKAIAFQRLTGSNPSLPGIVFCAGFQSNMQGTKATALEAYCKEKDLSFVRFDYQGCGDSSGDIRECTLTDWRGDVLAVLDQLTAGPQIMVGSSMGGLIMMHTYLKRPHRIQGLLGIATSADFSERLFGNYPVQILVGDTMGGLLALHTYLQRPARIKSIMGIATAADMPERLFSNYPADILETIEREGEIHYVSDHHSYIITKKFIEDARTHSILSMDNIPITCQVRLLHGLKDETVPFQVSLQLAEKLDSTNVHVLLRKNADHRFSQPDDITVLFEFLNCMVHGVDKVKDLALKSWQAFTVYSHPREGSHSRRGAEG